MKRGDRQPWRLTAALYPFGAGAVAVNVYFAGLIASWLGVPVLSPWWAFWGGIVGGVPVSLLFARHIHKLMRDADGT